MPAIAALGPSQTFSERAAQAYCAKHSEYTAIRLYPTIRKTVAAVGGECERGVLPIENMVDGHVELVLDLLLHSQLLIVDELVLPVEFACVANCRTREEITRVYAQFATQGQCLEFLDTLHTARVVTTASNGESLDLVRKGTPGEAALVPQHAVAGSGFKLVVDNVGDFGNNQTRFVALGSREVPYVKGTAYKTSLVVVEGMDRPGMLAEILGAFARRSVNLVSIMSRPTKESLGSYHFFIDIEGHGAEPRIEETLAEVQKHNFVRSLGSYPRAPSL